MKCLPLALSFASVLLAAGCPQPTPAEPITDVDGLGGGALTSKLSAPEAEFASLSADDAVVGTLTVSSSTTLDAVTAGAVEATSVSTGSLTVTSPVQSLAVEDLSAGTATADEVVAPSLVQSRGTRRRTILGTVVGVVPRGNTGLTIPGVSWAEMDAHCAADIAGSHVCTQEEVMAYAEALPATLPAGLDGASFNVFQAHVGGKARLADNSEHFTWVDNCNAWDGFVANGEPGPSIQDDFIQAKNVIRVIGIPNGGTAIRPDFSTNCTVDDLTLACCR